MNLRDTYIKKIRKLRLQINEKSKRLHPVDRAAILNRGMTEGEKFMKDLSNKQKGLCRKQNLNGHQIKPKKPGRIIVKIENVQSIQKDLGRREEPFLEHLRRTKDKCDIWMVTETWRQKV